MLFIPKEVKGMPDFYKITIHFVDKTVLEFEVVSHNIIANNILSIWTHDDVQKCFSLNTYVSWFELDKNWSKVNALYTKQQQEMVMKEAKKQKKKTNN